MNNFRYFKFLLYPLQGSIALVKTKFLVSKETVVLRRWERSKQKFGFIEGVDFTFINSFDKTKSLLKLTSHEPRK